MSAILQDLERRVTEKLIAANRAAHPEWAAVTVTLSEVGTLPPPELPADWPQFPREQWITYPHRRTCGLILADRAIDLGLLAEAEWLVQYAGRERIA